MKNIVIQIGDLPGWKRPVLNVINTKTNVVTSTRISQKTKKELQRVGIPTEG